MPTQNYFKKLKRNPLALSKISLLYTACGLYGFVTLLSTLMNVCIILEYGSNISLGALTSIFSIVSIISLFLFNKFTKAGKRQHIFIILSALLLICNIAFATYTSKITLIIYNLGYAITIIVLEYVLDIYRNSTLKESGLYSEISEHQTIVETIFGVSRIFAYLILMAVGLLKTIIAFKILLIISAFIAGIILILFLVFENKVITQNHSNNLSSKSSKKALE